MRPLDMRSLGVVGLATCLCLAVTPAPAAAQPGPERPGEPARLDPIEYSATGQTAHGDWRADVEVSTARWAPGRRLGMTVALRIGSGHLASLAAAGIKADRLCVLVTAERTFDADGWMRLPSDEKMSTLLTPSRLAIEGGVQGAVTNRFGYAFRSPLDEFQVLPASALTDGDAPDTKSARFSFSTALPPDLPPGLYRLRVDLGAMAGTARYNLNGYGFASRPFPPDVGTYFYSPALIPASGPHVSGRPVRADALRLRFPWVLLAAYNSNGYQGVVADEDRSRFALSSRSIIPDEVVLPLYDTAGNRVSYSLEPQFPADSIDALQNIPWDWQSGELSVSVIGPDGARIDLGTAPFVAKSGNGPTTKRAAFTAWKPHMYGRYTVTATGWIRDAAGRRYEGGGTYRFWIARRMTLATATFQGMPYPVGSSYGRDTQFNPAVPADVQVTASLYPESDPARVRTLTYAGKATEAGLFGAAQGMKAFPLDAPGEYHAQVLATYTDGEGHLWVSTMRHAGVVYAENSPVVARGKKFAVGGKYVDRGETKFEGYVEADGTSHLAHLTFPYNSGDVLLIGAEGQGANKVEPVLTYQMQGDASAWDTSLNGVGTTNLRIRTSNGYSPHLYPEFITTMEYYYGAAPRPGFMGRFIVGESLVRAPYWPVSPNSFGGQIGASPNGDAPGDIYRLLGGVVLRRPGQRALYSGYISSAFLLPKGSNNNRVIAPGTEDLNGPLGEKARFYLVGLRPGTAYPLGASFRPALQIDPLLPVSIRFTMTYPDGRQRAAEGVGDKFGSFAGPAAWPLDVAGVYTYQIRASWNGHEGRMPGLPESGGEFFVYSPARPAGASGLQIDGASQRAFSASTGVVIAGTTSAAVVHYTLITPGAVIEQGDLPVTRGRFQYTFDPAAVHAKVPLYDVTSITTGKPQIGRVIHLTFFSEEKSAGGSFFDVRRIILRGTTAIAPRTASAAVAAAAGVAQPSRAAGSVPDGAIPGRGTTGPVRIATRSAAALRAWDDWTDALVRSGDLEVVSTEADPMVAGRTHERLRQVYRGVPVVGGGLTRQASAGVGVSMFGTIYTGIDVDADPVVGAGEAARIASSKAGGQLPAGEAPTLVVLPLDAGGYALAWEATVRSATDERRVYVDAAAASVLLDYSALKAHQVQAARPGAPDEALDLAAHELAHTAIAKRPGFIYRGESGALEEAFADICATSVEFAAQPPGHGPGRADYLIGEDATEGGVRSLSDPSAHGNPDHVSLLRKDASRSAMQANSTIVSHAFYLAVEGGENRTSGVTVEGVGPAQRDQVERVFYRAFVYLLPPAASFDTARAATIQSARDLFGAGSAVERAVVQAWTAVGLK